MKSFATSFGCLTWAATSNFPPIRRLDKLACHLTILHTTDRHELVTADIAALSVGPPEADPAYSFFCVPVIFYLFSTMKQENSIVFAHVTHVPVAPLGLPCNTITPQRPLPAKVGGGRFQAVRTRQPCIYSLTLIIAGLQTSRLMSCHTLPGRSNFVIPTMHITQYVVIFFEIEHRRSLSRASKLRWMILSVARTKTRIISRAVLETIWWHLAYITRLNPLCLSNGPPESHSRCTQSFPFSKCS